MFSNYFRLSGLVIFCSLAFFGLFIGCKNAGNPLGHQGPFDAPNTTMTATPTVTSTPGPVNVSCYVNYNGNQTGLSWNLVDPSGNTVNSTVQSSGGTPFLFTSSVYGAYSVNIPTQTNYLYSAQPLTITGAGNYSVTFTCSGQTLSTNPVSFNYSSAVGYQTPVTVSYSYSGNLDVPVSIVTSGLSSAFNVSSSQVVLNSAGSSGIVMVNKNACSVSNTSLNLAANDFSNTRTSMTSLSINRGYSIPVTFYYSVSNVTNITGDTVDATLTVTVNDGEMACGLSYAFNTSFQPSLGPAPVSYSGSAIYLSPGIVNMSSTTFSPTIYTNSTDIIFTMPDGSTKSCSGCVNFSAPNGIGQTELMSTSY